jgi:hypothetical protein
MQITEIRIEQTKKTRDYENVKIAATVTLNPGEDGPAAIDKLARLIDLKINASERAAKRAKGVRRLGQLKRAESSTPDQDEAIANEIAAIEERFKQYADDQDAEARLSVEFGGLEI